MCFCKELLTYKIIDSLIKVALVYFDGLMCNDRRLVRRLTIVLVFRL